MAQWCRAIATAQLHSTKPELRLCAWFKSCLRRVRDWRWWGSLTMVPAGSKTWRHSSANHTTKTIHHHHHHHHHQGTLTFAISYMVQLNDIKRRVFFEKKKFSWNCWFFEICRRIWQLVRKRSQKNNQNVILHYILLPIYPLHFQ